MKMPKRPLIILLIGFAAIIAAFVVLYFEKQQEITDLENIEPEEIPVKNKRVKVQPVENQVIIDANEIQNNETPIE